MSQNPIPLPYPGNIDLIYNELNRKYDFQLHVKTTHETKAQAIIAFSGVMYGLMMTSYDTLITLSVCDRALIIISIGLFAIATGLSAIVLFNYEYRCDPDPKGLIENYLHSSVDDTKIAIILNLNEAYKENYDTQEKKATTLNWAFGFLLAAFIFFGLALLLSVLGA